MTVAQSLAALPALPMGKGPMILIMGGLFALGMSLVWTFLFPREAPMAAAAYAYTPRPMQARAVGGGSGPLVFETVAAPTRPVPQEAADDSWLLDVSEATRRMGHGAIQLVSSRPGVYTVRLTECRSCHYGAARTVGCEVERQALERAVEPFVPYVEVTESFCHARREGDCVFEIRTGGPQ